MRNFRNKVPVEYELVALGIKPTKKRLVFSSKARKPITSADVYKVCDQIAESYPKYYGKTKTAIKAFDNYFKPIEEALDKGIIKPEDMFCSDLREISYYANKSDLTKL